MPSPARTIHLHDALRLMHQADPKTGKAVPCSYVRYTHNRKTGEGGRRVEVHDAVPVKEATLANPRSYTQRRASRAAKAVDPHARHRPGDHWKNATRNMMLPNGDIDKMIIWLLVEFNGMKVYA